ncbi:hypothetical protein [Spongiactinospora sp. TRM90649]|uniref:hypothetical protein n=1 Tax=Spongiactinospora sp. TRM90649 TaxID=3031114 RepID=UPI0023F77359|nr:hypothetical protein [Spongiactinospora sp. TRM90649]MDF5751241.1 hypothetical protein [Spongiactinospora sp. TRM90649]
MDTVDDREWLTDRFEEHRDRLREESFQDHSPDPPDFEGADRSVRRCSPTRSVRRCWWCWIADPERLRTLDIAVLGH